jgi:hypothetical protein
VQSADQEHGEDHVGSVGKLEAVEQLEDEGEKERRQSGKEQGSILQNCISAVKFSDKFSSSSLG